jgi:Ca2+-binding RTX toxin-like protein
LWWRGIALALVLASGVALARNEVGTNGPDTLRGTNGADNLLGEGANDVLFGLGGRDNLVGGPGKDAVLGGNERRPQRGDKNLLGESGNDGVLGERGSDRVVGEEGRDLLDGGRGSDRIVGEEGSDWLVDGPFGDTSKDDTLSGGDGNDVFFVDNGPPTRDIVSCGGGFDRLAADTKDRVAADCEKVRRGPTAGQELNEELEEESGFAENFFEDLALAPFPE